MKQIFKDKQKALEYVEGLIVAQQNKADTLLEERTVYVDRFIQTFKQPLSVRIGLCKTVEIPTEMIERYKFCWKHISDHYGLVIFYQEPWLNAVAKVRGLVIMKEKLEQSNADEWEFD